MKNLKLLREKHGISQKMLSLSLKTTQQAISLYEQNKRQADYDFQIAVANYFNVSIDYLLGRVEDPEVKIIPKESLPDELASLVDYIEILKDYDISEITPNEFKEIIEFAKKIRKKDNGNNDFEKV